MAYKTNKRCIKTSAYLNKGKLKKTLKRFKKLDKKGLVVITLLLVEGCGLGDYTRSLGNGYTLERTNACCVYVAKKSSIAGLGMTRIVKPLVMKLYVDETKVVGVKSENQCCYLTEDETANVTPNGYFVIYKEDGTLLSGLTKCALEDRNISIERMEEVL